MPDTPPPPGRSHGRLSIAPSARPRELMDDRPALVGAWTARVITLFPQLFPGPLAASLTGKALDEGLWRLEAHDLRRFGQGKHRNVDDTPAGGGAGMVLRADVVDAALGAAAEGVPRGADWPVIYLSPRGRPLTQERVRRLAQGTGVTLLCGRFEGVDERVLQARQVEEVSLGDFVMTGGEIAAHALIDATVRLIPRVLGNQASTEEESFSEGLLEHPQYTRPTVWQGRAVPDILLSGHHAEIARWRKAEAERLTRKRRPDLWRAYLERQGGDPDGDREL
ncbi:MAG: tRNA (guanosine(37)-N1)-methyltransferase TrmD [Paracoccaceae bacterium]|jgi:tRNA (guanine37-N1)-methyltransferase|nr:tRNA (guanosine(37)-N1)-methyltransferase TrmD [Paracoccaceae bacterium]